MSTFWETTLPILQKQGISQADVARIVERPPNTISNWIRRNTEPSASEALKLARHLNTTVEQLVTGETSVDPADIYIKKNPELRSIVIKLGLHPELVPRVDGFLAGVMDQQAYKDAEQNASKTG